MSNKRGIQPNVAGDNLMTSPSSRDRGALSGTLAGVSFVWESAAWFIPAGRFSGLLVGGIAGVRLGRRQG